LDFGGRYARLADRDTRKTEMDSVGFDLGFGDFVGWRGREAGGFYNSHSPHRAERRFSSACLEFFVNGKYTISSEQDNVYTEYN
jgi:hypothetical protein